jgi:carbon storage regulator
MLVLSRKLFESIVINGDITVQIVDIRGHDGQVIDKRNIKVRLGITAPIQVPVHRSEVQRAIDRGQQPDNGEDLK